MEGNGQHPLKAWRLSQTPPMNQEDAAKVLGLTEPTLSRYETGTRTPSLAVAAKLSKFTGIPIEKFADAHAAEVAQ